jgi:hypothetical protein
MRILAIVIFGLVGLPLSSVGAQNTCHQADRYSAHFIRVFKGMMGPEDSALRAHFTLPVVDSALVTLVSDPQLCARAGHAIDSAAYLLDPSRPIPPTNTNPLYVIKIGNSFAVADLNYPNKNDYTVIFVFGSLWQFLGLGGA